MLPLEATDYADLLRTQARITRGVWACAVSAMACSAVSGWLTFSQAQQFGGLGLAIAATVDVALWVTLTGETQMHALGMRTHWGRAMRMITALMSIVINCGLSLREHHYYLAILGTFIPILLIGATEFGQSVRLALYPALIAARRRQEATAEPVRTSAPEIHPDGGEGFRGVPDREAPKTAVPPAPRRALELVDNPSRTAPVGERARAQVAAWIHAGRPLDDIKAAELAEHINAKPNTCAKILRDLRSAGSEVAV